MDTIVLGFGYKARHGKDTAGRTIAEMFGDKYDIRLYSFGAELKREVNELDQFEWCMRHGIPYDTNPDMSDPLCQTKHGKQPRLLQWYGAEYRRAQDPFYWVKKLNSRVDNDKPQFAVITDVRFPNEFYWVKARDGFTCKVSRVGFTDLTRDPNHISEIALDGYKFDFEISVLDGELDQLKKDACTVFELVLDALKPTAVDALSDLAVSAEPQGLVAGAV